MNLPAPPTEAPTGAPSQVGEPSVAVTVDPVAPETRRASRDAKVMIVDDEPVNIDIVQAYLENEGFKKFLTTTESTTTLSMIRKKRPDLVLLDIKMPRISGLEILEAMRKDPDIAKTPVIILTASNAPEVKLEALRLGASDFLSKPVDPSELMLRLENVLAVKAYQDHLAQYSERLEKQVQLRTQELVRSRQEAIYCLARAGEYRDDDTGHHVTRVGQYAALIATELGFPKPAIELIEQAAQLHDVGKIGIPDSVLHKPGKLDPHEFELIQEHCGIGRKIINPLSHEESIRLKSHTSVGMQIMGSTTSPVLKLAAVIAATHHEKWDGSGYPLGLKGEKIPIEGRITAVADVFDALSTKRCYKEAISLDECFQIIRDSAGTHFDPAVVRAFERRRFDIIDIYNTYSDRA